VNNVFQCVGGDATLVDAATGECLAGWSVYDDMANFVVNDPAQVVGAVVTYCSDVANDCGQYGYATGEPTPFVLTDEMLAGCGEAFAAGLFITVSFWGLGYAAGLILNAIKNH